MKKIILFVIGVLMYVTCVFTFVSCGPSAKELEEKRLADSTRCANDPSYTASTKSENVNYLDKVMQTMTYYKDETTGLYYAVVENNGQITMVVLPVNWNISTPNLRTFKSR